MSCSACVFAPSKLTNAFLSFLGFDFVNGKVKLVGKGETPVSPVSIAHLRFS